MNTHPLPTSAAGLKFSVVRRLKRRLLQALTRWCSKPGGRTYATGCRGGRRRTSEVSALPNRPSWICAMQRRCRLEQPTSVLRRLDPSGSGSAGSSPWCCATTSPSPRRQDSHRKRPEYHQSIPWQHIFQRPLPGTRLGITHWRHTHSRKLCS